MTAIEIFKTIALVSGILIAPFIIAALVCVLVVALGLIISLLRFLFTIEVDDDGGIHECIGCHSYDNTGKDGKEIYYTEVLASSVSFGETKAEAQQRQQAAGDRPQPTPSDGGFMDIPDGYDDGLPFD